MSAVTTSVEPTTLLNLIARAAANPETDVAKLQALIELQERVLMREAKAEYMRAMARVAAALEPVRKDAVNPSFGKGYASLGAIDTAIRPIYTEHGFSVAYGTVEAPSGHIGVSCTVSHESGYSETLALHAPLDTQTGGRARTPVQAVGSTVSYLRRYLVSMAFNVATADDDDGEASRRPVSHAPPMRTRREPPTTLDEDTASNGDEPPAPMPPFRKRLAALAVELAQIQSETALNEITRRDWVRAALERGNAAQQAALNELIDAARARIGQDAVTGDPAWDEDITPADRLQA